MPQNRHRNADDNGGDNPSQPSTPKQGDGEDDGQPPLTNPWGVGKEQ